jgi:hypothetical protein
MTPALGVKFWLGFGEAIALGTNQKLGDKYKGTNPKTRGQIKLCPQLFFYFVPFVPLLKPLYINTFKKVKRLIVYIRGYRFLLNVPITPAFKPQNHGVRPSLNAPR